MSFQKTRPLELVSVSQTVYCWGGILENNCNYLVGGLYEPCCQNWKKKPTHTYTTKSFHRAHALQCLTSVGDALSIPVEGVLGGVDFPVEGVFGGVNFPQSTFQCFSAPPSRAPGRTAAHPSLFPRRLVDGVPGLGTRLWRVSALPGVVVVVVVVGSPKLLPKKRAAFCLLGERFHRGPGGPQKGFLFFTRFFVDTRLPNLGLLACKLQVCQAPALGHSKS